MLRGAQATEVSLAAGLVEVARLVESGMRLKDACAQVAESTSLSKRDLYQGALEGKVN
jgi:16S rRNA (cytidine1402-2'-O)-methyltransferase